MRRDTSPLRSPVEPLGQTVAGYSSLRAARGLTITPWMRDVETLEE